MTARIAANQLATDAALKEIDEAMQVCSEVPSVTDNQDSLDELRGFQRLLEFLRARVKTTDLNITPQTRLHNVRTRLANANAQLQAFRNDRQRNRLATAGQELEEAIVQSGLLPFVGETAQGESLQQALAAAEQSIKVQLVALHSKVQEFDQQLTTQAETLSELEQSSESERGRLDLLKAEYQQQFSVGQESRNQHFADAEATRQKTLQATVDAFTSNANEQLRSANAMIEAAKTAQTEQLSRLEKEYRDQAQLILEEVIRQKVEVQKLVGVIGNLGVTSGYVKSANSAKRRAFFWQGVTVLSLGGLVAIAVSAFWPALSGGNAPPFDWEHLAARFFVAVTIGVLAAYAAVQGDRASEQERRNRKLALELEAIGPYLSSLPEKTQEEFRVEIGKRTFGKEDDANLQQHKSPANLAALMKSRQLRLFMAAFIRALRSDR